MNEVTNSTPDVHIPPQQEGPSAEGISAVEALSGVILSPKETFPKIVDRRWGFALVPLALFLATTLLGSYLFVSRVDMKQFVKDQIRQNRFASQMSEQQIEDAADQAAARPKWVQPAIGGISMVVVILILAAIFWLVMLAFGSEITFPRTFQATAWAMLPSFLTGLIFIVLLFIKDPSTLDVKNPIATNVAALLDRGTVAKPLYVLIQSVDLFKIWILALLSIGLAAAGRTRVGKAAAVVVGLYILWVLLLVGFAFIF
jgi:hypothetical protein